VPSRPRAQGATSGSTLTALAWSEMADVTNEARQDLLDGIADAIDEIGAALAPLGAAYEQLDEHTADRLGGAVPAGPGRVRRAQRTHAAFAER
jgi:hypothetical protein